MIKYCHIGFIVASQASLLICSAQGESVGAVYSAGIVQSDINGS
jgi:hypothetical protein